jgi:hypothetical protein
MAESDKSGIAGKLQGLIASLGEKVKPHLGRLFKILLVLVVIGVLVGIGIFFGAGGFDLLRPKPEADANAPLFASPEAPAAEDLYIPDEPDFVPDIMYEREQRQAWTEEDAAEFWVNPLDEADTDAYRDTITNTVDGIMETVP